jgi:hypothetical protein
MIEKVDVERVAEVIRKFKALIDVEHDVNKKASMNVILEALKSEHAAIVKDNIPCPPDQVEGVDKALKVIEDMYLKIAAN